MTIHRYKIRQTGTFANADEMHTALRRVEPSTPLYKTKAECFLIGVDRIAGRNEGWMATVPRSHLIIAANEFKGRRSDSIFTVDTWDELRRVLPRVVNFQEKYIYVICDRRGERFVQIYRAADQLDAIYGAKDED